MTEDEMVGWHHHQLSENELEQALGDSEGQESLVCCRSWGHRVGHDLTDQQQLLTHSQKQKVRQKRK